MTLKRPEKKLTYCHISEGVATIVDDRYNAGFNDCHDLDTAYLADLLKDVREKLNGYKNLKCTEYDVMGSVRDLIERIDNEA